MNQVYSIHSDFYYVKVHNSVLECKLREILKKKKVQIHVGDYVELENTPGGVNVICAVYPRKNSLKRPSVTNLDIAVVVSALKEPELDFMQLNRYITFFKYHNIPVILCFNKEDLSKDSSLKTKIEAIYKPLGYKLIFTSALKKVGIRELVESVTNKTVALCGASGVGKSSILNAINPNFKLRTGTVSQKSGRGAHTTRHCEILEFDNIKIVDTPGFSRLRFDFLLPSELGEYFEEIKKYKGGCKFSDCLHNENQCASTCAVIKNIENIHVSRYDSYLAFLKETKEHKTKVTYNGTKTETSAKSTGGKLRAKISFKKRVEGRNTSNQKIKREIDE